MFEYSISDQVIFSKNFQQFRTDIYETDEEKSYLILDITRLACLISLSVAYIVEVGLEASRDRSMTFARVVRIFAFLFTLGMFLTELIFIF